jgi:predicted ester cyclase
VPWFLATKQSKKTGVDRLCAVIQGSSAPIASSLQRPAIKGDNEMSIQENMAAQERFGAAVNSGKLVGLRDAVAPNALDHDPAPGQGLGPEGFIKMFGEMRASFPDLNVAADKVVTDNDNIAIAYTLTGTHKGSFLGVAPTGRRISARGVQIARFEKGMLVERWGSSDQLGILQQIGAHAAKAHA